MTINWFEINSYKGSQNNAFEELVCQLARNEDIEGKERFYRVDAPDGGVEAYCELASGDEYGWQAKFFTSIGTSQWQQIKKSFETALEKHPKLVRYYVCVPLDRADPRIKNKSLMDKWNEKIEEWRKLAKNKGRNIEFIYWGNSELIDKLSLEENAGKIKFWFSKDELNPTWFNEKSQNSIKNLGKRYLPEHNFELEISEYIDAVRRNGKFKENLKNKSHEFLSILSEFKDVFENGMLSSEEEKRKVQLCIDETRKIIKLLLGFEVPDIDVDAFRNEITTLLDLVRSSYEKYWKVKEKSKQDEYLRWKLDKASEGINEFAEFFDDGFVDLAVKPSLLIFGEAGSGKSHLLADMVAKGSESNVYGLFLLGQHFNSDEPPWAQILQKLLRVNCDEKALLGALNAYGEMLGQRILFVVDAINEGRGRYFWGDHIRGFVDDFKDYPWVALVLSVRDSYKELLMGDCLEQRDVVAIKHQGFSGLEYEASTFFFNEFGLSAPSIPLMNPEFGNPLFLILFCQGLVKNGKTSVPKGARGINEVFNNFIKGVEKEISKPSRLDYPDNLHLIDKVLNRLIEHKLNGDVNYIPYEKAYEIGEEVLTKYTSKRRFVEELVSEGVLSKNLIYDADKGYVEEVYFAYERFEDFETAKYLLDIHVTGKSISSIFKPEGALYPYIKEIYFNKKLVDAFSTVLPEVYEKELFELLDKDDAESHPIVSSFLESIVWRRLDSFNINAQEKYISNVIWKDSELRDELFEAIYLIAGDDEHPYNIEWLHQRLISLNLADRDMLWTTFLHDKEYHNAPVSNFISWSQKHGHEANITTDSRLLTATGLSWLFTSTNIRLRDTATLALVQLLVDRLDTGLQLLKKFENTDDPYVYERVFLALYGAALRSEDANGLKELSKYIAKNIFMRDEVYPNVLVRDSARNIVEYALQSISELLKYKDCIRAPYKSTFPKRLPTNKYIDDRYKYDYQSQDFSENMWSSNAILNSMTTEYGRGVCRYGDFGRYTFQSKVSGWAIDPQRLSNYACKIIFQKYGYNINKHGWFDKNAHSGNRAVNKKERIGKKYQWMAMHEVIARLSDNVKMVEKYGENKGQEYQYEGPWEPFARNLDPSYFAFSPKSDGIKLPNLPALSRTPEWGGNIYAWANSTNGVIPPNELISFEDTEGKKWIALDSMLTWKESDEIGGGSQASLKKYYWYHLRGYFVKQEDEKKVLDYLREKESLGGMGSWMPQASDSYQIYSREYYWSPAHDFFKDPYYGGEEWQPLETDTWPRVEIAKLMLPVLGYSWESGGVFRENRGYMMPADDIFQKLELKYSKWSGIFMDKNNSLACFDISVLGEESSRFFLRKDLLEEYLQKSKLKLLWACLGEKNIHGDYNPNRGHGLEISAICRYQRGCAVGDYSTKLI